MEPPDDTKGKMTKIAGQTVVLDGRIFKNTHFQSCIIVYRGGTLPVLHGDFFDDCTWRFEDEAGRTLDFLKSMAADPNSRGFVVNELLGIRS